MSGERHDRSESESVERRASPNTERDSPSASTTKASKLNQVVQAFYMKAAVIVIQARQLTAPIYNKGSNKKLNKWFNIDTVETDAFRDELRLWKTIDVSGPAFCATQPLVIEVVLLTRDLTANQTLVIVDREGRRVDVEHGGSRRKQSINTIVLERWQVQWEEPTLEHAPELPVTYKKSIVIFRSLFAMTRLLPAWQLRKRLARSKLTGNSLRVQCQIAPDPSMSATASRVDVNQALVAGQRDQVETYSFHKIDTAAGRLCISVDYRTQCDFRIDDSEALLSSQFLSHDQIAGGRIPSSLPSDTSRRIERQSSFTQLAASKNSMPYMAITDHRSASQPRTDRRPSATLLQPFKSPSLSASPSLDQLSNSPRAMPRTPSSVSIDRINARTSGYPQSQRIPNSLGESPSIGDSGSGRTRLQAQPPQMIKRYSSSFGQRSSSFSGRRRSSQVSETTGQQESSIRRSSSRSPSTFATNPDEQELGDFVSLLDNRKPLSGSQFRDDSTSSSRLTSDSMLQRSQIDLGKFHRLKESHINLTNSLLQSSSPRAAENLPSRHTASPVLTNLSLGSASPGKSVSPHTPAVPSRLSESSVMPRSRNRPGTILTSGSPRLWEAQSSAPATDDKRDTQTAASETPLDSPTLPRAPGDPTSTGGLAARSTRARVGSRPSFSRARSDSSNSSSVRRVHDSIVESPGESTEEQFLIRERRQRERGTAEAGIRADASPNPESAPDDEDLFFAMSDIHFGISKASAQ